MPVLRVHVEEVHEGLPQVFKGGNENHVEKVHGASVVPTISAVGSSTGLARTEAGRSGKVKHLYPFGAG